MDANEGMITRVEVIVKRCVTFVELVWVHYVL